MLDPTSTFILLQILIVLLLGISLLSIHFYFKARDLTPYYAKKDSLINDIAAGQREVSNLEQQQRALQNQYAVAKNTIEKAESERQWDEANKDRIADLKREIKNTQDDLAKINKQYSDDEMKLQDLQTKRQEEEEKRIQALAEKVIIENDKKRLDSEKQKLESKIDSLEKERKKYEADKNEAWEKFNEIDAKLKQAQMELVGLKKANSELQNSKVEITQKISELNKTLEDKSGKEHALSKDISMMQAEVDVGKSCWEDLDRPLPNFEVTNKRTTNVQAESMWLESFKRNLSESGIVFPERAIHAFHTGLKVADYSPLVVLAGISGTGKSLLPRLYAHAIGMNFLQVAVQPRWDGPQDMFGFYNYMENRFKATELSRLLWQFDKFNNKNADNADSPMNLVLLDEMNLARVEYYFSDMLSKLEVRRGLDPTNDTLRRNAEIEIESGARNNVAGKRRLYVGKNTLFVGTMNEDESTQSLSDKVMDRANVLRFGHPETLNASPKIEKFQNLYKDSVLSEETWSRNWVHDSEKVNKDLQKIMEGINQELAKIGRPFAHRVWQAMKAYVANYPVTDSSSTNCAIADQIEMKILPKLNGIDKDNQEVKNVLQSLENTIEGLKDEPLARAFKNCVEDTAQPFFQWRGVMR